MDKDCTLSINELPKVSREEDLKMFKDEIEKELLLRNITISLREIIELSKGNKLNFIKLYKFRLNKGLKEAKEDYDEMQSIFNIESVLLETKNKKGEKENGSRIND
jgi:ribosomal protein L7/L12